MKVKQISVFLENKAGRLSEVTAILSEAGINIRALSLADTSDFGVLRLIVNNSDKALDALKNNGFSVGVTDVVAVEVTDRPGGLHHILEMLQQAQINVEYMYAFVHQSGKNAVMIFRFDRINEAIEILQKDGIAIVDGEKLYDL
ncbi:MAG: ACT domain-containing protein [Desulfatirhabdiaceae bacterium]